MPKRKGIGRKLCPASHPDSRSRFKEKEGYKRKTKVGLVAKLTGRTDGRTDTAFVRNTRLVSRLSVHPSVRPSSEFYFPCLPPSLPRVMIRRASKQSPCCPKNVGRGINALIVHNMRLEGSRKKSTDCTCCYSFQSAN